ncbi:MAG TPA: hypothetical protein VKT82_15685 [Ktedonobacterales bacterium]|nr:hypothetical protein [Ktedonobacterales bacterium]
MMFDDIEETEAELIGHVKAACDALAFLQEVNLREAVEAGPVNEEWTRHMNALNWARTRLAMAAESLHDDLNHYNEQMLAAAHGEFPGIVELRRTTRSDRRKGDAEP